MGGGFKCEEVINCPMSSRKSVSVNVVIGRRPAVEDRVATGRVIWQQCV